MLVEISVRSFGVASFEFCSDYSKNSSYNFVKTISPPFWKGKIGKKWMLYCYSCCEYNDFLIYLVYDDSLHNLAFDGVKYALNIQQQNDELLFILCK